MRRLFLIASVLLGSMVYAGGKEELQKAIDDDNFTDIIFALSVNKDIKLNSIVHKNLMPLSEHIILAFIRHKNKNKLGFTDDMRLIIDECYNIALSQKETKSFEKMIALLEKFNFKDATDYLTKSLEKLKNELKEDLPFGMLPFYPNNKN